MRSLSPRRHGYHGYVLQAHARRSRLKSQMVRTAIGYSGEIEIEERKIQQKIFIIVKFKHLNSLSLKLSVRFL